MSFTIQIICDDCGEYVENVIEHNCPESPRNIAICDAEEVAGRENYKRLNNAWDEWEALLEYQIKGVASLAFEPQEIAVHGKCVLVHLSMDGPDYVSQFLENPTWGTVMLCFSDAIVRTGDEHHCFLEGLVDITEDGSKWPTSLKGHVQGDVQVYQFQTGS